MIDFQRIQADLLALVLFAGTLFLGVCLLTYHVADPPSTQVFPTQTQVQNAAGSLGAKVAHALQQGFGLGSWLLLGSLVIWGIALVMQSDEAPLFRWTRLLGLILILLPFCILLHYLWPGLGSPTQIGSGGLTGVWGLTILEKHFTSIGIAILTCSSLLAGLLLVSDSPLVSGVLKVLFAPFLSVQRAGFRYCRKDRKSVRIRVLPDKLQPISIFLGRNLTLEEKPTMQKSGTKKRLIPLPP